MDDAQHGRIRLRSAALWCATTVTVATVGRLALPAALALPESLRTAGGFAEVLVGGCGLAAVVAAGWLWVITTDVVAGVLRQHGRVVVGRTGPVRLLLLSACGAAVLGATAAPASADDSRPLTPHSLVGLPLPDRATGAIAPAADGGVRSGEQVVVRPGDSLWSIAEHQLGPRATLAEIVAYWHRVHDANAVVIGADPDLIHPGQRLELPPTD